jgi:hypothetical protein
MWFLNQKIDSSETPGVSSEQAKNNKKKPTRAEAAQPCPGITRPRSEDGCPRKRDRFRAEFSTERSENLI